MLAPTMKPHRLIVLALILILAATLSSCDLPLDQLLDRQPDQVEPPTQVSGESGPEEPQGGQPIQAPTITPEPPPATLTSSPSPTLTPTITQTPTPYVDISQNTNCRVGPGSIYDLLHTYAGGEQALLLGKDAAEDFWYTKDPAGIHPNCWLWGNYATPVGNTASLPVFTPPPTPTPFLDFSVKFATPDCGAGSCWLWVRVDNTGVLPLESVQVYAKNTDTGDNSTYTSNLFQSSVPSPDIANVPISGMGFTHTGQLPNPGGDTVKISVKICSQNDLGGICLTKNLTVIP